MNARPFAVAALVLSAVALPASARLSTGNLGVDVQSAVGSAGNVKVKLDNGVARLWGNIDNGETRASVREAALANANVDQVVDLLTY